MLTVFINHYYCSLYRQHAVRLRRLSAVILLKYKYTSSIFVNFCRVLLTEFMFIVYKKAPAGVLTLKNIHLV